MAVIPLSKIYHPDFAVVGQKPVSDARIDVGSRFGPNVIYAFIAQKTPVDLAQGPVDGGTVDIGRNIAEFSGVTGSHLEYSGPVQKLTEFTILFRVRRNDLSNDDGIFSDKTDVTFGDADGISINLRADTRRILFRVGVDNTNPSASLNLLNNTTDFWDVACVWRAGTTQDIYINGSQPSYENHDIASSHTVSSESLTIGTYFARTTGRVLDGSLDYCYLLNKALSSVEVDEFRADPFRKTLEPAVMPGYFTEDAAPVGGSLLLMNRSIANYGGMRQ